ncbi:MAG TPA: P1 family peptidase [Rhodothermales bacterium]|nr:P1 family peptidase [Rhodothermales bacterium]
MMNKWIPLAATILILSLNDPISAEDPQDGVLHFDFPAVHVGTAEYDEGPTGTTVFYFPDGVIAAADVRGGSPGTVNVPAVSLAYETPYIDAVVFSGGSSYGLSAATGVANEIKSLKREQGKDHIAGVLGAIIYDVGGRRFSRITPDDALGADALRAAEPNRFPLGARGAGRMAMQGAYFYFHSGESADDWVGWPHSGQGGAFRQIGPTKIAVFTVVNSMGAIVDREGRVVRCHRNDPSAGCLDISDLLGRTIAVRGHSGKSEEGQTSNTTLTLVVTNQKMPFADLQRLARQVHTSMARAIQPFATEDDGDVLYAVTTSEVEDDELSSLELAVIASEVAWDAVLSSVPELPPVPAVADSSPTDLLRQYVGTYTFPDNSKLDVTLGGRSLLASFAKGFNRLNLYFDEGRQYVLTPAIDGRFIVAPAEDRLGFVTRSGEVVGLTLNPGPWAMVAKRNMSP